MEWRAGNFFEFFGFGLTYNENKPNIWILADFRDFNSAMSIEY